MTNRIGPRITGLAHETEELRKAILERNERTINHGEGPQQVTKVIFEGGKSAVAALVVGLVGGVCLGVAVAVAVWVSSAMQAQATMNNWTSQEVTAIRSYITNGKLQPMRPRPMDSQSDQEKR